MAPATPFATADAQESAARTVRNEMLDRILREQLAIHCQPVPDWFQGDPGPAPEIPSTPDNLGEDAVRIADSYRRDPIFDMGAVVVDSNLDANEAAVLIKWARALDAARQLTRLWRLRAAARRLAQWPWFYADAVIAERDSAALAAWAPVVRVSFDAFLSMAASDCVNGGAR